MSEPFAPRPAVHTPAADDDTEAYAARLRRSGAWSKAIGAIPVVLFIAALLGVRVFLFAARIPRGPSHALESAVVVRVAPDGAMRVDGCAMDVESCLEAASLREKRRPGGGRLACLVKANGAPPEARGRAFEACVAAGFFPATAREDGDR